MHADEARQPSQARAPEWSAILYFIALHLAALTVFLPGSFTRSAVGAMLVLHWLTGGVGITFGYHGLITHRSFRAPKWLEYAVLFCGTAGVLLGRPPSHPPPACRHDLLPVGPAAVIGPMPGTVIIRPISSCVLVVRRSRHSSSSNSRQTA